MNELPHCIETELELLAIALHNKRALIDIMTSISPSQFYNPHIGQAFAFICSQYDKGEPTDAVSIVRESTDENITDALLRATPLFVSAERVDHLVRRFKNFHMRRVYNKIGHSLVEMSYDTSVPEEAFIDAVEANVLSIHAGEDDKSIIEPKQAAVHALEVFYEREASQGKIGISFAGKNGGVGLPSLDVCSSGGLQGGDLVLIAAQTGEGKTAIALNLAMIASMSQDYNTYYQNTEMRQEEMVFRMVSAITGVPFAEVYTGKFTGTADEIAKKRERTVKAFDFVAHSKIHLSVLPELTPGKSKGLARKFKHKYGKLDLLVIDYVGRMEVDRDISRGLQEWQILSRIAKDSKKLAQQLDCAVILLAQLKEDNTLEGAKKMLNDVDIALFVERLDEEAAKEYPGATHWLRKRKVRRSGKDRDILIKFEKHIQRISEVYFQ